MNKKIIAIAAVAVFALLGIIIYLLSGDMDTEKETRTGKDIISSPKDPSLMPGKSGTIPIVDEDPQEALDRYRKWAMYPPFSRPLHAGQVDLLDPYSGDRPAVSVIRVPAKDCTTKGDGLMDCKSPAVFSNIQCKMTPEHSMSVGTKDFKVTLRCFAPKSQGNLPLELNETKVYRKVFRKTFPSLPPIASGDDGKNGDAVAGDHNYTFVVRPGTKDWGYMFVESAFKVQGMEQVQRTSWFSTPHVVAQFRPNIADSNRNGHLVVSVPVTIRKAGYYKFDANLQKKDEGAFIASASWEGKLEAGAQTVDIQFWGKIIREANIDGPYVVREIRGRRDNSTVTPDMLKKAMQSGAPLNPPEHTEPLWEDMMPAPNHTTASYTASEFSNDEWQSEDKERRIKYLETLTHK